MTMTKIFIKPQTFDRLKKIVEEMDDKSVNGVIIHPKYKGIRSQMNSYEKKYAKDIIEFIIKGVPYHETSDLIRIKYEEDIKKEEVEDEKELDEVAQETEKLFMLNEQKVVEIDEEVTVEIGSGNPVNEVSAVDENGELLVCEIIEEKMNHDEGPVIDAEVKEPPVTTTDLTVYKKKVIPFNPMHNYGDNYKEVIEQNLADEWDAKGKDRGNIVWSNFGFKMEVTRRIIEYEEAHKLGKYAEEEKKE